MIDREIANAQNGLPSGITLKLNNLVDKGLVDRLYAASSSGVPVNLLIRGMCSLIPGLEGISENIRVISIVDRFPRARPGLLFSKTVAINRSGSPLPTG